jgi:hypothetical protein
MLPAPLALLFSEGFTGVIGLMVIAGMVWVLTRVIQVALIVGVVVLAAWFLSNNYPLPGA